ncbi:hypothetical protein CRENBAI_009416 [Crenichthys baileyi]|uniref:Uncharacterized protein n=1 Tax=Crenichthys baileyi TaxID=28760 RepID=A0AAV9RFV4_9TELE
MDVEHSHSPYILYTPRSSTYTWAGLVPKPEQPWPGPQSPALTPVPNNPHPERRPCAEEGSTWSKLAHQPEPPQASGKHTELAYPTMPPAATQTDHITTIATIAQGVTLSSSALPSPRSRPKCQ